MRKNRCQTCGVYNSLHGDVCLTEDIKKKQARDRANLLRKERDEALRSLGLTKVRGAVSGKVYWE